MKFARLIFCFLSLGAAAFAQTRAADLVVLNAKIRTMNPAQPRAEAFAVRGNKIVAVGANRQIRAFIGSGTKTIDARGKLILPGFNDAHVHFTGIGNQFFSIDLRDARTPVEALEKIKFYVRFLPKGKWILGGMWDNRNWTPNDLPTKELIDAATPDHPVFIYNADAGAVLANSLALKLAGVDKNTKEVSGGEIVRDASGNPNGILKGRAIEFVKKIQPPMPTKNLRAVIETATAYAASLGVTSAQDMHSDDNFALFQTLAREGKLKTRIYDCTPLPDWQKLARAGIRRADGDAMVRRGCLKHFTEGFPEELPDLYDKILAADQAGLQVMIHAIGESSNRQILDVFERVTKTNGARDRRFRVEHAHGVRPKDVSRFARAKIIASMQPFLFRGGVFDETEPYRKLLDSGAILAFGSDASITELNPLYGIEAAVINKNGEKTQAITVEEAVRAYTVGAAYAEFQENVKGTIAAGKLADFVILSDDIFAIKPEMIGETQILTTVVDGKIVYQNQRNSNL
jgi:predicted amidohydrolase YtcJ